MGGRRERTGGAVLGGGEGGGGHGVGRGEGGGGIGVRGGRSFECAASNGVSSDRSRCASSARSWFAPCPAATAGRLDAQQSIVNMSTNPSATELL